MKVHRVYIFAALLCLGFVKTKAQQQSVRGTWIVNYQKSELKGNPKFALAREISIDFGNDSFTTKTINIDSSNTDQPVQISKYTLDGKPNEKLRAGKFKSSVIVKTAMDKKSFTKDQVITSLDTADNPNRKINEQFSLSEDGKELILKRTIEVNQRPKYTLVFTGVYERVVDSK